MPNSNVERNTEVVYEVSVGYEDGEKFKSLKDARLKYKRTHPDDFDGVFIVKRTVETTTITSYTIVQSKSK